MSEHDGKEVKIKVVRWSGSTGHDEEALPGHQHAVGSAGSEQGESSHAAEKKDEAISLNKIKETIVANKENIKAADEVLSLIDRIRKQPVERQGDPAALLGLWLDAQQEASANRDCWLRAAADMENFKKRTVQEKSRLLKYGNEQLLRDLLPVLDNLERALAHSEQAEVSDTFVDGVSLISGMLKDVFERYGVREIKAEGEPFDPNIHETISRIPVSGKGPNVVVQEIEKGYMYHDRLLRPAKVVVSA